MLQKVDKAKFIKIASICFGVMLLSSFAFTVTSGQVSPTDVIAPSAIESVTDLPTWISTVINLLAAVAGIVAVFFLIFSGYKYVTAGGNAETAGEARTGILNAIIGIVVILAAWALVRWLVSRLTGQENVQI